jgi:hypothetical protein
VTRPLNDREKTLVLCLLKEVRIDLFLDQQAVIEMNDGGMGSLYFAHPNKTRGQRSMKKCIVEKQFLDIDGTPILVSLNLTKTIFYLNWIFGRLTSAN